MNTTLLHIRMDNFYDYMCILSRFFPISSDQRKQILTVFMLENVEWKSLKNVLSIITLQNGGVNISVFLRNNFF